MTISAYGLVVTPTPTIHGTIIFAELTPSAPLLCVAHFDHGWHKWLPLTTGRAPWQAHIRWWYEIIEDGPEFSTHMWQHDGGAMTLRQAITKASRAVGAAVEERHKDDTTAP